LFNEVNQLGLLLTKTQA